MKNKSFFWSIFILCIAASCDQNPIFYTISTEPALTDAFISGTPANMAVFNRKYDDAVTAENPEGEVPIMYAASGNRIFWYAKAGFGKGDSKWNLNEYAIPQPGKRIIGLAATKDHLYALCLTGTGSDSIVRRIGTKDTEWTMVEATGYPKIQSIYADPDDTFDGRLFAGASVSNGANYAILYLDESSEPPVLKLLKNNTGLLSGAAYDGSSHYLCTSDPIGGSNALVSGIFQVAENDLDADFDEGKAHYLADDDNGQYHSFMGMIRLEDNDSTILAVERTGGAFYKVNPGAPPASYTKMKFEDNDEVMGTGRYATGALALWETPPELVRNGNPLQRMLIAGIQGDLSYSSTSSNPNGYVEFVLDPETRSLKTDSDSRLAYPKLESVHNNDRYIATIGIIPVNHLLQAPPGVDENKTFFASTQNAGLWSYRFREDNKGWHWNAETN